jgi:beta-glucosidase
MGEDSLLGGTLAGTMVQGIQEGNPDKPVMATLKHWVDNEQELDRQTSSSNVDARTQHEIYNLPFEIAIKTGNPGSVMCSYNQINGIYSCENPTTLTQYLKNEIGFKGYVMSDFGAVHSTAPSLNAGLDQELNRPRFYSPANIKAALAAGQITEAVIDQAAFRVVRAYIAAGLFDHPLPAVAAADVSTPEHQAVARKVAEAGAVLLKNQDQLLPLSDTSRKIAVIGPTASNTPTNGVSASSVCTYNNGGSCPNPVAPLDGITARASQNGSTVVFDNGGDLASAAATARSADVAIVFGYYREGEFTDRPNLSLDNNGDALIEAVAAANPNTVVILQTGGPALMPWLGQVKGVAEVWYAGQEMGNAIAALLWGDVNFSGKLPMTFPKSEADLPTAQSPRQYPGTFAETGTTTPPNPRNGAIRQVDYLEGLQVGYKWYDSQGIEPLFPFGFGLSYTTFAYSHLQVTPNHVQSDKEIRVRVRVTNTGNRPGTEVAQVYLGLPAATNEPPKRLVGWANVTLNPGEFQNVEITINPDSADHPLSYWDTASNSWVIASGNYTVYAGTSSRNMSSDTIQVRAVKSGKN